MSNDELQEMENMIQRMLVVAQVNFAGFLVTYHSRKICMK